MDILNAKAGRIRLSDLHNFMVVAKIGNISRAALTLNSSQPVVSKSIAALETIVGAPLFSRRAHGVELTKRGARLVRDTRLLITDFNKVFDGEEEEIETVRVGIGSALSGTLMAPAIVSFHEVYPHVKILTRDGTANDLHTLVADRVLDMCVCRKSQAARHVSLETVDLTDVSVGIYAGINHPLAKQASVSLADLAAAKWLLSPASALYTKILAAMFARNYLPPPVASIESLNYFVNASAMRTGSFLAIAASGLTRFALHLVELNVADDAARMRTEVSALVTLKGRQLSLTAQKFADHVVACARELREDQAAVPLSGRSNS